MRVAVIGSNGQLGSDVCQAFQENNDQIISLNHEQIEIRDHDAVCSVLEKAGPDLVVNTAAMHNVEACEKEPLRSFSVNGVGAMNLAKASNEIGCTLMHISTDYVFDGSKREPYTEEDCPNPLNAYGNTKLSGEIFVQNTAKKYFILRVSGLYGINPCRAKGGQNFVTLMLKLAKERGEVRVVDDEILTPTNTADIARQIVDLSQCLNYGLYHVTAQGYCSWYDFADKIFEYTDTKVHLSVASPGEFPSPVSRPKYTVLENKALKSIGYDIMPHWTTSLQKYLDIIKGK